MRFCIFSAAPVRSFPCCLIAGFVPLLCLIALFAFYLSLTIAGQTFLSFQWDILLARNGISRDFLRAAHWWLSAKRRSASLARRLFLLQLLLFKLMFMSGVVKLTSGDDSWWNLTALDYHYWTQPLPTVLGWWAAQGLRVVKKVFHLRCPVRRNVLSRS